MTELLGQAAAGFDFWDKLLSSYAFPTVALVVIAFVVWRLAAFSKPWVERYLQSGLDWFDDSREKQKQNTELLKSQCDTNVAVADSLNRAEVNTLLDRRAFRKTLDLGKLFFDDEERRGRYEHEIQAIKDLLEE